MTLLIVTIIVFAAIGVAAFITFRSWKEPKDW
jgi:hypothetical protein